MATKIRDLALNPPTKKSELNRDSMLKFMQDKSAEEKKWFVDLMKSNVEKKRDNLHDGKIIDGYNMKKIREEFSQKYFYEISDKYKRENKQPVSKKPSFEEELEALLK